MRLKPDQLAGHLKKQLLPIYFVTGDDPLLVQECSDQIRKAARQQGCSSREVLDADSKTYDWNDLLHSAASLSLFAERRLIELRLAAAKPGTEGSKALCKYTEIPGTEDTLLIISGKIDKASVNSKWFKALDRVGGVVQVWPVDARALPGWLEQRIRAASMSIDKNALELLCELVEGNLLAAVQEIEKLKLLAVDGRISLDNVTVSVSDNARYNLYSMVDAALRGDVASSLRMLHGLRGEGTDPILVLWALGREIRTLNEVQADCDRGQSPQQALKSHRVWQSRIGLMQRALSRHDRTSLSLLIEDVAEVDGSIKGFADGNSWDLIEQLVCRLEQRA